MKTILSYAQNREDIILRAYFKDVQKGFYVDVGANHPVLDSVTKLFYDQGWHGINIEPNATLHALLAFDRPKDVNLNIGVSEEADELVFTEYNNHGLSTFSDAMRKEYEAHPDPSITSSHEYPVSVLPLAEVFKRQKVKHIHFMKVDVEGYEYHVLASNDWKTYRPEMICIESNHMFEDWRPLLTRHDYTKVFNDGLNDYYLANESMYRQATFDYPSVMLTAYAVVPLKLHRQLELDTQNERLWIMREQRLGGKLAAAEWQNGWYERAPLKWSVVHGIQSLDRAITARLDAQPHEELRLDPPLTPQLSSHPSKQELQKLAASYSDGISYVSVGPSVGTMRVLRVVGFGYRGLRKAVRVLVLPLTHSTRKAATV